MIAALKSQLYPFLIEQQLDLEHRWAALPQGWNSRIPLDKWVSTGSQVYHQAQALRMEGFKEDTNSKPILAFLYTPLDSVFCKWSPRSNHR